MMQPPPPPPPLDRELLASTPSFRKSPDEWPGLEEITGGVDSLALDEGVVEAAEDDGEEFEFAVFSGDPSFEGLEPISADEIFSNGRILPVYPLFNRALLTGEVRSEGKSHEEERDRGAGDGERAEKPARLPLGKLLMEDRDHAPSTSSSEAEELEGIPADSYCLWTPSSVPPSPDLRRRSHSTGNTSKRWRLRDLVIGRSHSDGRKRFLFLAPPQPPSAAAADTAEKADRRPSMNGPPLPRSASEGEKKKVKGKGRVRVLEMDMVTAHRLYYGKGAAAASGDRHRSYLPYRKDLVGFFGNVNGAARGSHHPF